MPLSAAIPARRGRRVASARNLGRTAGALVLALVGLLADRSGAAAAPLAFAAVLILGIGLPHGASDHLLATGGVSPLTRPRRLALFLLGYLGATVAALLLWRAAPGAALAGFLALSAVHFAIDDVADAPLTARLPERLARGLMPVALPALLHHDTLAALFAALSTPADGAALAGASAAVAPVALALCALAVLLRLRDGEPGKALELAAIAAALALFSPLVGFALVFALVHSRGQTRERMVALRLPNLLGYLGACWPTLVGAALLFAALACLMAGGRAPALGPLFIGLSALTVPHMLVTPFFARAA